MMREILFRGKRVDNGEWVEGSLIILEGRYFIANNTITDLFNGYEQTSSIKECNGIFNKVRGIVEVIPETVGQYTGLTDKNGKKIFEGDILKQKTTSEFAKVNSFEWEHYGIVRFGYYDWDEGEAGCASMVWYIEPLKSISIKPKNYLVGHIQAGLNQCDILNKYYPMEVIGNIHDNPELLEVQNDTRI